MTVLSMLGAAVLLCGLAARATRRLPQYQCEGLYALSCVPYAGDSIRHGNQLWTGLDAACFAFFAYRWWMGGGGDDTKRRLRSLQRRFTPSRRTAPQAA